MAYECIRDDVPDLTTGVATLSSRGDEGENTGNDTAWLTQVGPRGDESGLGGHEAGVSGVDEGSRRHRSRNEFGTNGRVRMYDLQ